MKPKLNSPLLRSASLTCAVLFIAYRAAPSAHAATLIWDSDTGTAGAQDGGGTWTADGATFWDGTTNVATSNDLTTDIAQFGNGGTLASAATVNVGTQSISGLIFGATTTHGYTLTNGSASVVSLGGNGIVLNSGAQATALGSANLSLSLGAAQTWNNDSSSLFTVGGAIANGANTLTIGGTGNITISSAFTGGGAGGVTKVGGGTLTLSGSNTYTGETKINEGTVQVNTGGTLGATSGTLSMGTGSAGVAGTVGNLTVNTDTTVGAFTVQNNNATLDSQLNIANGKILTASSFTTGVTNAVAGDRTALTTGASPGAGGTLTVGGNVTIGLLADAGTSDLSIATVDLSGLSQFNATSTGSGYLRVGYGQNSRGRLTLANDNLINVGTISVGDSNGKNYNVAQTSTLNLGAGTNSLQATNIVIGQSKGGGVVQFATSDGTIAITGAGGSGTADITIGNGSSGSYQGGSNLLALAGHAATVSAGNVIVGARTGSTTGGANPVAGITFDTGTFTATSIQLATVSAGSPNTGASGTFTLGTTSADTGALTVNGDFVLANNTSTVNNNFANGTLIINGGTATINGKLKDASTTTTGTSTTTLTLDGGTLDMTNHAIGGNSSGDRAIGTLNFRSGTLKNVSEINAGTTGLTKTTSGTLILEGTNTYTGATAVNAGKLVVNGNQPLATGATTVAAGTTTGNPVATLSGNGGLGGSLSLAAQSASGFKNGGVLAPTASASGTALDVAGTTTFGTGSIFEWNLVTADGSDPGANAINPASYSQLAGAGAITGSDAIFKIVLSGNTLASNFWDTNKSWNNVFSGAGATRNLDLLFTSFDPSSGLSSNGTAAGRGQFTFNGSTSTLSWTAVPEPSSALAGLLIGAGILRRRRQA